MDKSIIFVQCFFLSLFFSNNVFAAPQEIQTQKTTAIEAAFQLASIEANAGPAALVSAEKSENKPENAEIYHEHPAARESSMEETLAQTEQKAVRGSGIEEVLSAPVRLNISASASTEKNRRGLFSLDFIVPLYYSPDKSTLLFYNPKDTLTQPTANEYNQGLGLRRIFDDSFILGINSFFDRRLSHTQKYYSQAGVGLEYLSYPLDIRLNWYKPLTPAKTIDDGYYFGSTSLIYWENKEEPLQGLDFELGFPFFDRYTKTRFYLGGFFYQSRLSKDVNGFRARTETNLTHWLSLDTTFNSKADGQTEFIAGARLILPFEWTNLFRPKQGSLLRIPTNSYLEDRLFDRVVRDLDIQSCVSAQQRKADGAVSDIIYVDNSNTSGTATGTLEHPWPTLAQAFTDSRYAAGMTIYINKGDGTATGYTGNYTLANNVVFWGSGYNGGFKGITATSSYPIIDGTGTAGDTLTLANNNTIMGLKFDNAVDDAISYSATTRDVNINHNTIEHSFNKSIHLVNASTEACTYSILDNTITDNNQKGQNYYNNVYIVNQSSGPLTLYFLRNQAIQTSIAYDDQLDVEVHSGVGPITAHIKDNVFNGGLYPINIELGGSGTHNIIISGNTIRNLGADGIYIGLSNNSTLTGTISGNTISNCGDSGFYFYSQNNSSLNLSLFHNSIFNNPWGVYQGAYVSSILPVIDLGGGALNSEGYNSIYGNTTYDVDNQLGTVTISGQHNWWGTATPLNSQFNGVVDYTNWLTSNPN